MRESSRTRRLVARMELMLVDRMMVVWTKMDMPLEQGLTQTE